MTLCSLYSSYLAAAVAMCLSREVIMNVWKSDSEPVALVRNPSPEPQLWPTCSQACRAANCTGDGSESQSACESQAHKPLHLQPSAT